MREIPDDAPINKLKRIIQLIEIGQVRSIGLFAIGKEGHTYDYLFLPEDEDLPYMMMLCDIVHHQLVCQCEEIMEEGPPAVPMKVIKEEPEEDD